MSLTRRDFIALAAGAAASAASSGRGEASPACPPHLSGFEKLHAIDPRAASRQWFREARYGLFMHYGLYSALGRGEWVMLNEKIPVARYERLKQEFTADKFNAEAIAAMAVEAGMKYINITSRHHDSFCLFESSATDYTSVDAPCGRDLIAELAAACHKQGLGLFLYYSYACDWRHPYFYAREAGWENARPAYETPDPAYKWRSDGDFRFYIEFVHSQLRELLTHYGPLAGIWFDPIMGYYARPDLFPIEETYELVRSLQPHCLISFKQGANGDEDFATPERTAQSLEERVLKAAGPAQAKVARIAWEKNRIKQFEICDTLQDRAWGHNDAAPRKSTPDVLRMLGDARAIRANLLLNTGPLGDGSIHPVDKGVLLETGERLRREGFPE